MSSTVNHPLWQIAPLMIPIAWYGIQLGLQPQDNPTNHTPFQNQLTVTQVPIPPRPLLIHSPVRQMHTEARAPIPYPIPMGDMLYGLIQFPDHPTWASEMIRLEITPNTLIEGLRNMPGIPEALWELEGAPFLHFLLAIGYYNEAAYILGMANEPFPELARLFSDFPHIQPWNRPIDPTRANFRPNYGAWANMPFTTIALNPLWAPIRNENGDSTGQFVRPEGLNEPSRTNFFAERDAFMRRIIHHPYRQFFPFPVETEDNNNLLHVLISAPYPNLALILSLIRKKSTLLMGRNDNGLTPLEWAQTQANFPRDVLLLLQNPNPYLNPSQMVHVDRQMLERILSAEEEVLKNPYQKE